jgi:ABC-type uncharacterized transport system substrate-binding protein
MRAKRDLRGGAFSRSPRSSDGVTRAPARSVSPRVGLCTPLTLSSVVTLALALLAAPLAAGAQTAGKVYRIGFLRAGEPPKTFVDAFLDGLRERGYVGGQDVVVEFRLTDGSIEQIPQLAEEVVRLKVDVIPASGALPALAAKKATMSVPIVFVGVTGPVELGLVPSLGRRGAT